MPRVIELLRQGRHEDIWQMCCGYLHLDIEQFMAVQKRLLLDQIESLGQSTIGRKIMRGAWPRTVDDFRNEVPLTTYEAYCPELSEKREDALPQRPAQWVHSSGRSGEYSCKWIPITPSFVNEISPILYGLGLLSSSEKWGDSHQLVECPHFIFTVAPRPYMSGALASFLQEQTPSKYYPSFSTAENLPFDERIRLGFKEALSGRLDYFFGLSVVLNEVGNKISQSASHTDIRPYITKPRAMFRLTTSLLKSRIARHSLLPKDLWHIKGIITSGLDSSVYKEKIKHYWGRYPLDVYANTEGGVIATQTWDYNSMTFIPNLNFLEFIPEKEHLKWQINHRYQPKTVLLDEVNPGECYEIVLTNFHGGSMVRYRVGDMVRITSLKNDNLGIAIPQMVFERRADDLLDFGIIRLTEKSIWRALEASGIPYTDWLAYKIPGELTLNILIEPRGFNGLDEIEMAAILHRQILQKEAEAFDNSRVHQEEIITAGMKTKVILIPEGSFARYAAQKQAQGADLAHLKPPHVNPNLKVLSMIQSGVETTLEPAVGMPSRAVPIGVG